MYYVDINFMEVGWVCACRLDLFESGYDKLSCCCEKSNDIVGSINGELLDWLSD